MQISNRMTKRILTLLFMCIFLACAEGSKNPIKLGNNGGAQDWGGGEIPGSSEAEVKKAIEQARIQFAGGMYLMGLDLFTSLLMLNDHDKESKKFKLIEEISSHDPLEIFKTAKVSYSLMDCPNVGNKKHAGVSSLSSGATICFNIQELRKLPAISLNKEIIILLTHEVVHMLGYDEPTAHQFQQIVQSTWPTIEKHKILHQYGNANSDFLTALVYLNTAFLQHQQKIGTSMFWYSMGIAIGKLNSAQATFNHLSGQFESVGLDQEKLAQLDSLLNRSSMRLSGYISNMHLGKDPLPEAMKKHFPMIEEIVCSLAKGYLELTTVFSVEDLVKGSVEEKPNQIEIKNRKLGISCSEVPPEKFKLAEPNEYFFH